jgi:hypothetical protein
MGLPTCGPLRQHASVWPLAQSWASQISRLSYGATALCAGRLYFEARLAENGGPLQAECDTRGPGPEVPHYGPVWQ